MINDLLDFIFEKARQAILLILVVPFIVVYVGILIVVSFYLKIISIFSKIDFDLSELLMETLDFLNDNQEKDE